MSAPTEDRLRVPGASLYYTVRGAGPLVLILPGGDGDADASDTLAAQLVDHYTVVTYDRRGLSRSMLDAGTPPPLLETHSDDAHRLLAALTSEPASVLGYSIGALIGLDLVARHPEQVGTLIAHEPPAPQVLPVAERAAAAAVRAQEAVEEVYQREGVAAAMQMFLTTLARVTFDDREPEVVLPRPTPQRTANLTFFLTHDAPAVRRYTLDMAALRMTRTRLVLAGGRTSREGWPFHAAAALADQLGAAFVEFPGGHNGAILHPRAFAARARAVLNGLPGVTRAHNGAGLPDG